VTAPAFEINAGIRAKRLVAHVPPDAQTRTEGEEVTLARHEQRSGVPATIEAGELYSDVVIDKRIVGEMQHGHTTGGAAGQAGQDRGQAAREASDAAGQQHPEPRQRSSSRQRKRGTKLGSRKRPTASADSSSSVSSGPVTRSSTRNRRSAEQAAGTPKRKSSSPRSPKRGATAASSSAGDGLAEAVRSINEGATILRELRRSRRRG
jgi:hypothetical protein